MLMGCDEAHLRPCHFALALDALLAARQRGALRVSGCADVLAASWVCDLLQSSEWARQRS